MNIAKNLKKDAKLFVDTVSVQKTKRIKNILKRINVLKTNKLEIEELVDKNLEKISDVKDAAKKLVNKGIDKVFVTLGANGLIYCDSKKCIKISNPKNIDVVDTNGCGDIFISALVLSEKLKLNIEKAAKLAQCASIYKLGKKETTPEDLSIKVLWNTVKKYYKDIRKGDLINEK